ncbi:peptidoglycan D,D-transpeptidase FtsI family protein [Desulfitobacterium sp.]|uniref:peptidoglycan D,D-transpeptidase FtsI family protein n=1 Tax=Desulfitobacterium sp. TaxID=49981 RepID=UPI002B9320B6|nr:penicillin-binding transpeptidase domain-containing protein [Desulfitobacterium sp.]HVJ50554.1 penicillin-binding transpeptidase domain-containing protein [Desulfitobacterium sp.]
MKKGLRYIALGFSISFIFLSFGLVYWQVVRSDALLNNPANRRLILMEQRVDRGGIFDRNGEILAQTQTTNNQKKRVYPKGEVLEPLLGYATLQHGSAGMEANFGDWLLGIKQATPTQEIEQLFQLPRQGNDVVLTLDYRLQKVAYEGLKGKMGAAVALDPRTGEILALVSQPGFDPNSLDQNWAELSKRSGSPFVNRAFALYPPGSTMKVITSAAIFRSGVNTGDLYNCTGSTVINGQVISEQNDKAHGWVNYDTALADSCNTYFATFGVQSGDQQFLNAVKGFGFGQTIPFELPVSLSQITNQARVPKQLNTNLLAASTFGQGEVLISPFHMALVAAGIANHGVIMTPHIVNQVIDDKQNVLYKTSPKSWLTALSTEEAAKIKNAMVAAVNDGTASPGGISGIQVAAKTGSAEPGGNDKTHAWYIAFAPAEAPQIAVAVMVEHGGTGGGAAAPIARDIIQTALNEKVGESK